MRHAGKTWGLRTAMGLSTAVLGAGGHAATTVSFQNTPGGYAGTLDVIIGRDINATLGSSVGEIFLDGRYAAISAVADEKQLLINFADIFGTGPGQVPLGAKILDAKLELTTGESSGNAQSPGPFGVAEMLIPFDGGTSWDSINAISTEPPGGPNMDVKGGATFRGGITGRPADRGYVNLARSNSAAIPPLFNTYGADVTPFVQNWSNGGAQNGLAVTAGTTDGWQIFTTGVSDAGTAIRPKLVITYDEAPQPPSTTVRFQQGVNSYFSTSMAQVDQNGTTADGATLDRSFLDGPNLSGTSRDILALVKFENIFVSQGGTVPDGATILDAQLIVDSGGPDHSQDAGTNGNFGVHQMLVDWHVDPLDPLMSTHYADFGATPGLQTAENEISPALDLTGAMIASARSMLNVTDAVKNWKNGASNFGLAVKAFDTTDGWSINFTGSVDSPPQLQITYTTAVVAQDDADFNGDGPVDGNDFLIWQRGFGLNNGSATASAGDANADQTVDGDDLAVWKVQFGTTPAAASAIGAVPEPSTFALFATAAAGCWGGVRRRR